MKRFLVFTILLSFLLTFVFAKTTIKFMEVITSPDRTKFLKGLLSEFEKRYPDIEVELISVPWDQSYEKLMSMVVAGNPPDVVEMPEKWVARFAAMGKLVNLENYLKDWPELDKFVEPALKAMKIYKNEPYIIPYGFYIRIMFCRKDWLEEKGLSVPQTTDEFIEVVKKLTDPAKGRFGTYIRGAVGGWDTIKYWISAYLGTAEYFDEEGRCLLRKPEAAEGLKTYVSFYKNGWAPPESVNWGYNEIVAGFYTGVVGIIFQDPEVIGTCKKHMEEGTWMVSKLPIGPHNKTFVKLGFAGWSMFKTGKEDAAWKLVSFLASEEIGMKWEKYLNLVPAYKKALEDPFYMEDPYRKVLVEELNDPRYEFYFEPWYLPEWAEFFQKLSVQEFQKVLLGKEAPEKALEIWSDFLEKAYKKWIEKHGK